MALISCNKLDIMKIDITPKTAMRILGFLREFIPYDSTVPQHLQGLKESVEEFNTAFVNGANDELIDDAIASIEVDALLDKSPPSRR